VLLLCWRRLSVVTIFCRTEADMLNNLASMLLLNGELLGRVKFGIKYEIQFGTLVRNTNIKARQLVVRQIL